MYLMIFCTGLEKRNLYIEDEVQSYLIGIERSEHILHVRSLFLCGAAVHTEDPLELV